MEEPPKKFFRLVPGGKVRLRYGYVIQCDEVIKDDEGEVLELRCSHVPGTKAGAGEKVIHPPALHSIHPHAPYPPNPP